MKHAAAVRSVRNSDEPVRLWSGIFLRTIPFPRGARLAVFIDSTGSRQELLARRRDSSLGRLTTLVPIDVSEQRARGRWGKLIGWEGTTAPERTPAAHAFAEWLSELIEAGLQPEDPHPAGYALLLEAGRALPPRHETWGRAAERALALFGIWAAPTHCPRCGTAPDGRPSADLGCADCFPLPRATVILTAFGSWCVPLARVLTITAAAYQTQLHRRLHAHKFVFEMGRRGML